MLLSEKFALLGELHARKEASSDLGATVVEPGAVGRIPHSTGSPQDMPYLFEADSQIRSNWIDKAPLEKRFNFVGAHSYMNGGGYLRDGVLIGRYCSIGRRVSLAAGSHHMDGLSTSPALHKRRPAAPKTLAAPALLKPAAPALALPSAPKTPGAKTSGAGAAKHLTILHSDVWIGDGAVIVSGLELAVGTVIGANAVVTRDTEPYGIYAGCPARMIRKRFPDALCEALLASAWWERPHLFLQSLPLDEPWAVLGALADEAAPAPVGLPTYRTA